MSWNNDDFPEEDTDPGVITSANDVPTDPLVQAPMPGANPGFPSSGTGAMRVVTKPASSPAGGGVAPAPLQPVSQTLGTAAAKPAVPGPGFPATTTGAVPISAHPGFQTGATPAVGQAPGAFPNQPTGGFQASPTGFAPTPQPGEPEITPQTRVVYAASGLAGGALVGVVLGIANSLLEGVSIVQGLGLTIQIAVWFGAMVGIVAGWKPDRFDNALENLKSNLGLDD